MLTDMYKKSADMGEGGATNRKKVLTYFMDGSYSVDSIKRTVHLAFHGLFSLLKILFNISKQYF